MKTKLLEVALNPGKMKVCKVACCKNSYHAKGYCRNHYEQNRRCKIVPLPDFQKPKCKVEGCNNLLQRTNRSGYCSKHIWRLYLKGTDNKGERNCRWNGGTSEYKNHYAMKKIRKEVIKERNGICCHCGKKGNEIHHLDGSKSNHNKENLALVCHKCHISVYHANSTHISKYCQIYGTTLAAIAYKLKVSPTTICVWHKKGILFAKLKTNGFAQLSFDDPETLEPIESVSSAQSRLTGASGKVHVS